MVWVLYRRSGRPHSQTVRSQSLGKDTRATHVKVCRTGIEERLPEGLRLGSGAMVGGEAHVRDRMLEAPGDMLL